MGLKAIYLTAAAAALVLCGCASYKWRSSVPEPLRSVSVPEFINETAVPELGAAVTRQTLREFQREGTFSISDDSDCAVTVMGVLKRTDRLPMTYDRSYGMRASEYRMRVEAEVSLVDRTAGKVLFDNRKYKAETTFMSGRDLLTGENNAVERLAADIARQVVDDVVNFDYKRD